ncbi:MAG: 3-carboxy-cis,cis-muconate cycloisomerase [Rhodospirillales bacterium]|nr:3-carboxy-cis,cis-muconate cycloisomerase [Rhodospirillales bacterium]
MTKPLVGLLFGAGYAAKAFSDPARLQRMLDFEAALARAEATVELIPQAAATAIAAQCRAELFDLGALATAAVQAGNPAIPMVKALTALVARTDPAAARFVHWGATSQDAMDTGLVLQLRRFLDVFATDLDRLATILAALATKHKTTPMVGRTWLQHAVPVTFGLKAAGWLDAVTRHRARLAEIRPRALVLQLGGAAGTLAALGGRGLDVAAALSRELDLPLPAMPWHSHRDRIAEIGTFLGLVVGTLGKIARDLSLLMQTDVAEAFEPTGEGRGGSSTMPHKRNPVASAVVLAAAVRAPGMVATLLSAMVQDHERGLGGWHAEWETLPELAVLAAGALRHTTDAMAGLEVDSDQMRRNLDTTHGLIFAEAVAMALAPAIGRSEAHALLERACRRAADTKRHLKAVLADDAAVTKHLKAGDLDRLFDPANAIGEAQALVDRVLREHR